MKTSTPGWTALQRRHGSDFLEWLDESEALLTGFRALATALQSLLEDEVRTPDDARDLWAAVPAVLSRCDDQDTYSMPEAAFAYAWLHLPDRYVRTWLALRSLVEQSLLPMGTEGVRVLDVGTGPGPSAFATHDFYAAMVRFADASRSERWRQPAHLTCVESSAAMNHSRHRLAEILCAHSAPEGVLSICHHITEFESIQPGRERKKLEETLRNEHEDYYDHHLNQWESAPSYEPEEANHIANTRHRYRLFTFSNFLTTRSTINCLRASLMEILTDARPGSVLLTIGGSGHDYPDIYKTVGTLAADSGFSRNAGDLRVSSSHAEMDDMVYSLGADVYRRLKRIAGDLSDDDPDAKKTKAHFEGNKRISPTSEVHAYRK